MKQSVHHGLFAEMLLKLSVLLQRDPHLCMRSACLSVFTALRAPAKDVGCQLGAIPLGQSTIVRVRSQSLSSLQSPLWL